MGSTRAHCLPGLMMPDRTEPASPVVTFKLPTIRRTDGAAAAQAVRPGGGVVLLGGDAELRPIGLGRELMPEEPSVCKVRHYLEKQELGGQILEAVSRYLQSMGVKTTTGDILDATIIHAPSSTKNREQERDTDMHQTSLSEILCRINVLRNRAIYQDRHARIIIVARRSISNQRPDTFAQTASASD